MEKQLFDKTAVELFTRKIEEQLSARPKAAELFRNCFKDTLDRTLNRLDNGGVFVVTGDIPAMWLRDSSAQLRPYIRLAKQDVQVSLLIEGVIKQQIKYILHDPYANAFNETENGNGHQDDQTDMSPMVWERKYEIDSLCYPIQLAYLYWKQTDNKNLFDHAFLKALYSIIEVWITEQDHENRSAYRFERFHCPDSDTLSRNGKGTETRPIGMTWSGFRPSDDACKYGYLIPSNMFASVVLGYIAEIAEDIYNNTALKTKANVLKAEIEQGIKKYGIYEHPVYGKMYAYETDGLGNYNLMDDANVPSLLSMPFLGYCKADDEIYQNTRAFLLSEQNPYYYVGKAASGIGSPHTPQHYIWHIALAIQGLTAVSLEEKDRILNLLEKTDGDTGLMHEGFHADDPTEFTRSWFSWANAMYCEFVIDFCENSLKKGEKVEL
ncbi:MULTISPECIES: glycoside hydrolase family 125 protein [Metabacillus]|uniref:Glycosyl hydrolase n=2 Tax=Metabacillus TaxID=2675233 RepID=A0A179SZZ5_9BACI|nr:MULTISPECIES: glycoside hydrolase family 125 protein [Metabacillus]OAS85872.1 glycosyl hydrolase [Metabacillus litoralis]QNF30104.1 glycoside hydrolase family 125 protein [Metabacillus sp. KUDC1714]